MAELPAYCVHCGTTFRVPNIIAGGGILASFSGNYVTCPNPTCRRMASIADGVFDIENDRATFISGPPLTKAILKHLEEIARRAQSGEITAEQAVNQAGEIDPRLAPLFQKFLNLGAPALGLLIALIALYYAKSAYDLQREDSSTSAAFYEQATELYRQQLSALEEINDRQSNSSKSGISATEKAKKKPASIKKPSNRRTEVNRQKREDLRRRRMMFKPRRPPSDS